MRQGLFSIVFLFLIVNQAQAARKDALMVHLNQRGLELLAKEVEQRSLAPIHDQPIDDQETRASGIDIEVSGAKFSADFSGLRFKAVENALQTAVTIENVKVDIDSIKLKKKVLRSTLRSTCKDTTVKLGHREGESLDAVVALSVSGSKIVASVNDVDFSIDDENYEVHGPQSCTGDLGVGYLIRAAVRLVLDNARKRIETAIQDQVRGLSGEVEERLNAVTHQTFVMDLTRNPLVEGRALDLNSYPSSLSIGDDDVVFKLGVNMAIAKGRKAGAKSLVRDEPLSNIGALAVDPGLITDALALLISQQRGLIWLDESRAPGLKDILTQSTAASIWPDLQNRVLDNPRLRLGLRLVKAPVFSLNEAQNLLGLEVPTIVMEFYITEGGVEKLYTTLSLSLATLLQPKLNARTLTLGFAKTPSVQITGQWGAGITPDPDFFEADVATVILQSVFDYLYASGAVVSYELPPFTLGGAALQPSGVKVTSQYIQLGLVAP